MGFAERLYYDSSLHAEFGAITKTMEIAISKCWSNLWIKTDSSLMNKAFSNLKLVLWKFRRRWNFCLDPSNFSSLVISHIFQKVTLVSIF